VVEEALRPGPQTGTRGGEPVVVVDSLDSRRRVSGSTPGVKALLRAALLEGVGRSRDAAARPDVELL